MQVVEVHPAFTSELNRFDADLWPLQSSYAHSTVHD